MLTFPALVALGVPALTANATSTVALVPGAFGSFFGYRRELAGVRSFALWIALPSAVGGLVGALLLLVTPASRFDAIVPWLVLGATALFAVQRPLLRVLRDRGRPVVRDGTEPVLGRPPWSLLAYQLLVAVYGGYFGAGLGILMLAAFGLMGFTNIHRMNGLKSWGGTCANIVAAVTFAVSGLVDWRVAGAMAVGAIAGGYGGSTMAQRVPQDWVRAAITVIGVVSGLWLFVS